MPARPLNEITGMPQMAAAFAGWAGQIVIYKRTQQIEDGLVSYVGNPTNFDGGDDEDWDTPDELFDAPIPTLTRIQFRGVIQPLNPKLVMLKPEGQRAFTWFQVHCFSGSLNLDDNDQIIINGDDFKVMAVLDYRRNNYMEYHIIRDYQGVIRG